jgi:hypothetical protein
MTREVVKPGGSKPTGADGRCRRTVLGHALNPEPSRRRSMPRSEEWQRVYGGAPEIILHPRRS